jgi:DNA-binding transcriptional ArsR family regulator
MGVTKTEGFTEEQNVLATFMKALAHPARVAIIEHLLSRNQCICADLVDSLPLAQATISQHLTELKKAGLIKGSISGTSICYCLDQDQWAKNLTLFESISARVKEVTGCC